MRNPIIDNRIVHDTTFAARLLLFIDRVEVCDMASEEEKEYLQAVAQKLLAYQRATATNEYELKYLTQIP